jgi:hypothetical protein
MSSTLTTREKPNNDQMQTLQSDAPKKVAIIDAAITCLWNWSWRFASKSQDPNDGWKGSRQQRFQGEGDAKSADVVS